MSSLCGPRLRVAAQLTPPLCGCIVVIYGYLASRHPGMAHPGHDCEARPEPACCAIRPSGQWSQAPGGQLEWAGPGGVRWTARDNLREADRGLPQLDGRWVYFWGDSTLRQLLHDWLTRAGAEYDSYGEAVGGKQNKPGGSKSFEQVKAEFRGCPKQQAADSQHYAFLGGGYRFGLNEVTCELQLGGVRLTFDWKAVGWTARDDQLLGELAAGQPDVMVFGFGLHMCHYLPGHIEGHLQSLRRLINRLQNQTSPIDWPIIWVLPQIFPGDLNKVAYNRCAHEISAFVTKETQSMGNVVVLPVGRLQEGSPEKVGSDGVHFAQQGGVINLAGSFSLDMARCALRARDPKAGAARNVVQASKQ